MSTPRLERIAGELADARRRIHDMAAPLTDASWGTRPARDEWSVAECVIHLNLTSRAFLPLIADAIASGRALKLLAPGPFRRDPVGWFVHWLVEPTRSRSSCWGVYGTPMGSTSDGFASSRRSMRGSNATSTPVSGSFPLINGSIWPRPKGSSGA